MIAIMDTWEVDGSCVVDNTRQYLLLLLFKVGLNALMLAFCMHRLSSSFMSTWGLSLCVADGLLFCAMSCLWLFWGEASSAAPVCLLLGHMSTVYSLLPLPVLLLGGLDYTLHLHSELRLSPAYRTAAWCLLVLLLWALACMYSYLLGDPKLVQVQYLTGHRALGCPVQDSSVVVCFCTTAAIGCLILLLSHRASPQWLWTLLCPWVASEDPPSSLLQPEKLQSDHKFGLTQLDGLGQDTSLSVSLTLGFTLNWAPFLITNITSVLLGYALPAYITVNLLWLLCAENFMVCLIFSTKGGLPDHCIDLLDNMYTWNLSWHGEALLKEIHVVSGHRPGDILHI